MSKVQVDSAGDGEVRKVRVVRRGYRRRHLILVDHLLHISPASHLQILQERGQTTLSKRTGVLLPMRYH